MINKIGKITIYVNDQKEAIKFWTEKIGFVVKFEQAMGPNMKWVEIAPNKEEFTTFVLYDKKIMKMQKPNIELSHPNIILSTMNIKDTYNQLKSKEVQVGDLMEMPYGSMFAFKDQDGNEYLIRED